MLDTLFGYINTGNSRVTNYFTIVFSQTVDMIKGY